MVRGWWSAIVLSFWWSILSKSPQQIFSANLLSRFSQQIFSASSQQIFSADHLLWSGVGGQLLSYHLPCHLLWSGVGGQLLSYHFGGLYCMSSLEGPFRGAFGKNHLDNPILKQVTGSRSTWPVQGLATATLKQTFHNRNLWFGSRGHLLRITPQAEDLWDAISLHSKTLLQ